MAKRTPSPQAKAADLQTTPAQDVVTISSGNAQPLPPVVKSGGKSKVKTKFKTLPEDESLPMDEDIIGNAQGDQISLDVSENVLVAQANTSSGTPSTPSSVGEALLREAQLTPTAASQTASGLFGGSWAWPVALGVGGLAVAAGASGGDKPASAPTPAPAPEKPSEPVTPTTYDLKIMPMVVGAVNAGITINVKDSTGNLLAKLEVADMGSEPLTLQVARSKISAGQVLHLEVVDSNGTGNNYRDVATNKSFSLATQLNAWTVVPNDIADKGTLDLAITPLTELAAREMQDAKQVAGDTSLPTQDEILAFNNAIAKLFKLQTSGDNALNVDLAQTQPVATNWGTTFSNASASQQAYGRVLALISGLAKTSNTNTDLNAALVALESGVQKGPDATTFSMLPDLTADLQKALASYNASTTFFKLPGLVLSETQLSAGETRVAYEKYDDGLSFKLYAPPGLAVGTEVTIRLQALDTNGVPIAGKTFDYVYPLKVANDKASYAGETVTIPTLDGDILLDARAPVADKNGNTLISWNAEGTPTGVGVPDAAGIYSFEASLVGQDWPLGNTRFKVDGHRVSVTNIGTTEGTTDTPVGYVKQGDTIEVRVVLDKDILWSDVDAERPTFDIGYTVINNGVAETVTETLIVKEGIVSEGVTLPEDGTVSTGADRSPTTGRILVFQHTFGPDEKVVGPITVGANALKAPEGAEVATAVGSKLLTDLSALVSGGTELPTTHLVVDTVAPDFENFKLTDDTVTNVFSVDDENFNFTKDTTPNFSLDLKLNNEPSELKAKLYAYDATGGQTSQGTGNDLLIAQKVVQSNADSVSFDNDGAYASDSAFYTKIWQPELNKLGAQGKYFGFYAVVEDAAGNVTRTLESSDVMLWLDNTAPVNFTIQLEPSLSSTDPNLTDSVISDNTPTFTVTGEGGATAHLYLDTDNDGRLGAEDIALGNVLINGDYGDESITANLTVEEGNKLVDGEHQFLLTLTDAAGNTSDAKSAGSVTVDTKVERSVTAALVQPESGYYRVSDTLTITLSFEENIFKNPLYEGDLADAYISFTVGDVSYNAKLDTTSLETSSLRFTYTFKSGDIHDGVQVVLDRADLYEAPEGALVDRAGNIVTSDLLNSTVVTVPGTVLVDTVAPPPPELVLSSKATSDDFLVNLAEALNEEDGLYQVTAEAGSTVALNFKQGDKTVPWKTIDGAGTSTPPVVLTEEELAALGVFDSGPITLQAISTDAAGNQSTATTEFTLDVVAPDVQDVTDNQSASVVGKRTAGVDTVIQFTVTLNEALKTPLSETHFAVKDDMGTVSSVTANTNGTYTVAVTPASDKEGDLVLQLTNTTGITDLAGNPLLPRDLGTAGGKQTIDTKPPVVKTVTDNITTDLTNGPIVFTVEFNEAIQDKSGYDTSNFSATHGTVTQVQRTSATTYTVTVQPDANLDGKDEGSDVVLSLKAGLHTSFEDVNGNSLSVEPGALISLKDQGAVQRVDNVAPSVPTLSLTDDIGSVTAAEAMAGLIHLTAEPGATVSVTYTGVKQTLHKPAFTATDTDTDLLSLSAEDVRALGDGAVQVDVVVQDVAGNTSAGSLAGGFTLDTRAPLVSAVTDEFTDTLGGAQPLTLTVVFDEDVVGTPTAANFVAIDPVSKASSALVEALTDGNVERVVDNKTFKVTLTPKSGVTGTVALQFKGTGLTDAAGNPLADADLSALNTQAIHTQTPQVTTVTDTFAPDYANAASSVDFIVTFNTALKSDLSASVLKSGFAATLGTVTAVTAVSGSGNLQYKVSVTPAANVADGQISLSLTGVGLVDALGNLVQATTESDSLGGHIQKLDSSAPAAPTVSLATDSDTGSSSSDGITSNNRPSLLISRLEDGADVRVYRDANNNGTFDAGDAVLVQAKATGTTLTAQVSATLADGTYNDIRVSQTDVHGNASPDGIMGTLEINTRAPGVLSNLSLDYDQDTTLIGSSLRPARDQATDRAAPKFDFTGGTVGNTVVLFNDKNTNNQLDDGEFLGSALITNEDSSSVEVSPFHALTAGSYPNVKVTQVSASGVSSTASAALRGGGGQVLKISPATPTAITIESSEAADPSNKNTLVFSVTGAMEGSTIQVLADQYDASGSKLVASGVKLREGVATSSSPDNLSIDVSALNGQFKNFKAYQRFGGVDGAITNVTGLTTVILDHAAPTLTITTTDADLTLNDTAELTFSFSEKVTGFDVSDITGLTEGNLGALTTTDDGKTWTATYTPAANTTQNLSLGVAAGAVTDLVGNVSTTDANVTIEVHTAQAPVITAPEVIPTDLYAGIAAAIGEVGIQDANGDLASVTLSVARGSLSVGAVDAANISLTEAGTTLTLSKPTTATAEAFATALSTALSNLSYTASGTDASTDTLTIRAVDSLNNTQEHSVALTVWVAPQAPVNALTAPTTDVFSGQEQAIALSVRDDDNNLQTVVVSAEHGALTVAPVDGITTTHGSDGHSLTLAGAQSAIASALASLKYISDTAYFGTETLSVVSTDGTPVVARGPLTDTDSITFSVKAKPVSIAGADVAAGQIYAGVAYSLQGLSVSDLDQGIQSVTVSVSAGALRTSGAAPAHLSLAGEGTTSLTFTKNASASATDFETELQTVLNGLGFTASGAASDSAPVVLTLTSTDSDGFTGTDTANLVVQAAPLAPVNSLPTSPVGVVAGQAKALTGLSVSDADGNLKQIELSVAHGNLTLSTTPAGVEVTGLESNKLTLSVTNVADMAKLNTALANLLYTAEAGYSGDDSVSMVSTDTTPEAAAGPLSDTGTLSLVVLAAPVNSMGSALSDVQAGTPAALTGLSVSDADSASNFTSVTLSVAHGSLSLSVTDGVTSSGTGSTDAPLVLRASSLEMLNQALASVNYNADAHFVGTDTLTLTSQDGSATSLGGPLSDTDTLSLNVVNSPSSGSVTISGDPTVGSLLSANTSDLRDANGLGTLSYKWYAGDAEVGTNSTYQLTTADLGKAFRLEVGYTDGAGQSESSQSLSTAEVILPTSLALGKALAFTNDPANGNTTDGALSTSNGAFVFGYDGYYVLDVNGDGTITGADRTTYGADLDAEGRITTSTGVTLQLLSVIEWQDASAQLLALGNWPNGSKDATNNSASDGFDFWTRDAGDVGYQQVYSTSSVYTVSKDFSGNENALHYHAFKVI